MEEAILGRGDGQMGLSCLFKALSSLFCCQLESVLYWQDDLCFLVKSARAPFEYSWRGVNIEGPRTVRCQCFSNSWSKPFVLSRGGWDGRDDNIFLDTCIYICGLCLFWLWYDIAWYYNKIRPSKVMVLGYPGKWRFRRRSKIANQMSKSHHNPRLLSNKVVQIEECSANTWMSIMHLWLAAPQATHDNEEPTTTSFYSSSSGLQVHQHSCYWRLVLMFLLSLRSIYDLKLPVINPKASKSWNGNWCLMFNVSVISIVLFRLQ